MDDVIYQSKIKVNLLYRQSKPTFNNWRGAWKKALSDFWFSFQIALVVFTCGTKGEFDLTSKVTWGLIPHTPSITVHLRTVPTIVTAHTLCASRDTQFPMGGAYWYRDIFARFKTMRRKQNLEGDFAIQKEIGVTMHFSEIIKFQFGKKKITIHCFVFCCFLE